MDGQILQQRSSYRRGLVLGLTMAEIMILLVFCLLIAMATFLKREETRRMAAEQELQQQKLQNERTRDVVAELSKSVALAEKVQSLSGLSDPQAMQKFEAAQSELSGALSRLLVTVEQYPELKANANYMALQEQLEGTENRIAVERRRFNEVAQDYNTAVKRFPMNFLAGMFGFTPKAYFQSQPGAEKAPEVKF